MQAQKKKERKKEKFKSLIINLLTVKAGFMLVPHGFALPCVNIMDGSQTVKMLVK